MDIFVDFMSDSPRYWGSWKGRVIKAIALDKTFSWNEIRDSTGLSPKSLNKVLAELFDAKALEKNDNGEYRVNYELYKEYTEYVKKNDDNEVFLDKGVRISKDQQNKLIGRIDEWIDFKGLELSLRPRHFYIDEHLDDLSKDLIKHCQKEVLVINPFVDRCNLTESLVQACENGKDVRLLARPPKGRNKQNKKEYHQILRDSGVKLYYNKVVHAKLMVLDRAVALVSSMNLYGASTAGSSWEAGMVSVEETVVENVINSIFRLMEKPESIKQ